jgi:hypothetical protein
MSDVSLVPSTPAPILSRDETLSLALKTVVPHSIVRVAILGRTIYSFWKIGDDGKRGMSGALSDPTVPRQTAYLVAFDGKDTFQMGYARNGEEAQCVCDIPLSRLMEAVNDLKNAGF